MKYFILLLIAFVGCGEIKQPQPQNIYDLSSFLVKDTTIVSSIKDSVIVMPTGKETTAYELLRRMGEDFYHLRTSIRKSACADCHSLKSAGTGEYNKSPGGGEHVGIYNNLYKDWTGEDTWIEEDRKPIKNFSVINSFRLQEAGTILHTSEKADFPLEFQIGKAMDAHMVSDIVLHCQQSPLYNNISMAITKSPLSESVVKQSISAFEQSLISDDNRMNQFIRGETDEIKYFEGFELFMKKECNSCHATSKIAKSRALVPLQDSVKATCLDCNISDHFGYFHTSEDISLIAAVRRCDSFLDGDPLTRRQASKVTAFIRNNLHSPKFDND